MPSYGPDGRSVLIYDHSSWSGYLLRRLLPQATRLVARRGDRADNVLADVPAGTAVFIFHVDLTWAGDVPLDRSELTARLVRHGVAVINHDVVDISKRGLQHACAELGLPTVVTDRSGLADDLVIVKTDRNYGGVPETLSQQRDTGLDVGPGNGAPEPPEYVVARRCELDEAVWTRPDLVVENYVSNAHGQIYRAIRLGDAMAFMVYRTGRAVDRVPADSSLLVDADLVPTAVKKAVAELAERRGIGFGAFDVIVDDAGQAFIIDFNSTPYWGAGALGALRRLTRPSS